jgi:two-component sensor histidine kinase
MNDVLRVRQVVQAAASALELGSFRRTPIATASVEMARNAILHAEGGIFAMELATTEDAIMLTVSTQDQGGGIPAAMVEVAYDRRPVPTQSEGAGLGLGLRGIARLADRFSIETDSGGATVRAGFLVDGEGSVTTLANRISETLGKLDDTDRASALAEQNKELLQALSERDLMLKEVHHRTQNNLTLINSLVRLREAASESNEVKAALRDVGTRIHSIAAVHAQLQRADRIDSLELLPFVQLIVDQMTDALSVGLPVRRRVSGANPSVSARQAVDLCLLIGELVTNSLKHAFAEQPDPEIMIVIGVNEDRLEMAIRDNGCGLPDGEVPPSKPSSLGWQVIRSIPPKYDGTIEVANCDGLCVAIKCRLDRAGY